MLDRTTDCAAELILIECRASGIEVASRVQAGVSEEFERISVQRVTPRFAHDRDNSAVVIAILRIKVVGENPKFFNRIKVRNDGCPSVHMFLNINAIHQKPVGRLALSIDGKISGISIA